jgi:hypothetical protein
MKTITQCAKIWCNENLLTNKLVDLDIHRPAAGTGRFWQQLDE